MLEEKITIKENSNNNNNIQPKNNLSSFEAFLNYFNPKSITKSIAKPKIYYALEKTTTLNTTEIETFESIPIIPVKTIVKEFSIRKGVTNLGPEVWKFRNDLDVYREATKLNTKLPEVDHIIEIQFIENAFNSCPPNTKVFIYSLVKDVSNQIENLNVTSQEVNQAKKSPITSFLNGLRSN